MPEWIVEAETLGDLVDGYYTIVKKFIRCRDCKHRPMLGNPAKKRYGFNVIAPKGKDGWEDNTCPYLVEDGFYSGYPDDDDFCSLGERREK